MAAGIDYSFARPGGATIKEAGYSFVCRYLSHDQGKTLEADELADLRAVGLDIVVVWESYQNRSLTGYSGGVQDATDALNEANKLGMAGTVIYFAVDFDSTEGQDDTIDAYLKGAASVIGADRVGIYGGYWIVKRCADEGTAKWLWQTVAWSGGNIDPRIHIYQNGQGGHLPGTDYDESKQTNFGQWPGGVQDMPITEDNLYRLIRGITGREPTYEEAANTAYLNDPNLAIETFWNNGGKQRYDNLSNPTPEPTTTTTTEPPATATTTEQPTTDTTTAESPLPPTEATTTTTTAQTTGQNSPVQGQNFLAKFVSWLFNRLRGVK